MVFQGQLLISLKLFWFLHPQHLQFAPHGVPDWKHSQYFFMHWDFLQLHWFPFPFSFCFPVSSAAFISIYSGFFCTFSTFQARLEQEEHPQPTPHADPLAWHSHSAVLHDAPLHWHETPLCFFGPLFFGASLCLTRLRARIYFSSTHSSPSSPEGLRFLLLSQTGLGRCLLTLVSSMASSSSRLSSWSYS